MSEQAGTHIEGIMGITMDKMKALASADTIIGEQIVLPQGLVVIPVSKVTYGFASGGSDFPSKQPQPMFGGAGGAGMTIQPVAFLVAKDGKVSLLPVSCNPTVGDKAISMLPDLVDRFGNLFGQGKKEGKEDETL